MNHSVHASQSDEQSRGNHELRILILEDNPIDAELMETELRDADLVFVSKRVDKEASFIQALREFAPGLILSDFSLPSFSGEAALDIAMEQSVGAPFIFVSGALGEERAIELLKKGQRIMSSKIRMSRLVPAVVRALQEVQERNERHNMENALSCFRESLSDYF